MLFIYRGNIRINFVVTYIVESGFYKHLKRNPVLQLARPFIAGSSSFSFLLVAALVAGGASFGDQGVDAPDESGRLVCAVQQVAGESQVVHVFIQAVHLLADSPAVCPDALRRTGGAAFCHQFFVEVVQPFQFIHVSRKSQCGYRFGKLRFAEVEQHALDGGRLLADREAGDTDVGFQFVIQ